MYDSIVLYIYIHIYYFERHEISNNSDTVQALLLYARLKMRSRNDNRYALNIQFLMPYANHKSTNGRLLSHTGTISFSQNSTGLIHTACVRRSTIFNYHTSLHSVNVRSPPYSRYGCIEFRKQILHDVTLILLK